MARKKPSRINISDEGQVEEILDSVEIEMSEQPERALSSHGAEKSEKKANKDYNQHPKFQKFKKGVN